MALRTVIDRLHDDGTGIENDGHGAYFRRRYFSLISANAAGLIVGVTHHCTLAEGDPSAPFLGHLTVCQF